MCSTVAVMRLYCCIYIKQNNHLNTSDHYLKVTVDSNDGKFGKKVKAIDV